MTALWNIIENTFTWNSYNGDIGFSVILKNVIDVFNDQIF